MKKAKYPTPCAADGKDQASGDLYAAINNVGGQLTDPDMGVIQAGGQLNPDWVEWLMGWPIGWTDLKPLVMDKFQEWLQAHGTC